MELAKGYNRTYELFESPLMQRIRREAYGEDIGQHSWISADEIRGYLDFLQLSPTDQFLDFGCGPCGPLTFIVQKIGCKGVGFDLSAAALRVGLERSAKMNLERLIEVHEVDANEKLPDFSPFDALVCFDVILHLRDRTMVLKTLRNLLRTGARAVFTDAGVVTGPLSNSEVSLRSVNGYTQFVPPGFNESVLTSCGFTVRFVEDKTDSVARNANGRLRARANYSYELIEIEGKENFEEQQKYLETAIDLSLRKSLSRYAYMVEAG